MLPHVAAQFSSLYSTAHPQLLATAEEEAARHADETALLRRANEAAAAQRAADQVRLAEELRLRLDLQVWGVGGAVWACGLGWRMVTFRLLLPGVLPLNRLPPVLLLPLMAILP